MAGASWRGIRACRAHELVIGLDAVDYVSLRMICESGVQHQLTCETGSEQDSSKNSGRHCNEELAVSPVEERLLKSQNRTKIR